MMIGQAFPRGPARSRPIGRGPMWDDMHGALLMLLVALELLVHELAHAVAALRLTRGPVHVHVGRYPGLVRVRFGRLHVQFHVRAARGVSWSGICIFRPTIWPRQEAWIAALGPLASLLWALGCAVVLLVWGHDFDALTCVIVAAGAVLAAANAVNTTPAPPARCRRRPASDRRRPGALGAEGRPRPARSRALDRTSLTRGEMLELRRDGRLPASARRDVTASVAPPAAG